MSGKYCVSVVDSNSGKGDDCPTGGTGAGRNYHSSYFSLMVRAALMISGVNISSGNASKYLVQKNNSRNIGSCYLPQKQRHAKCVEGDGYKVMCHRQGEGKLITDKF